MAVTVTIKTPHNHTALINAPGASAGVIEPGQEITFTVEDGESLLVNSSLLPEFAATEIEDTADDIPAMPE